MGQNYDNSAKEAFAALLTDSDVVNGTGAASFIKKNGKPGQLFMRQGNVYGADNPNMKFDLATRLLASRMITPDAAAYIRKSRLSHEKLCDSLIQKEYAKQNDLLTVTKEFFLGVVDSLYAWDNINIEWKEDEPFDGVTVPQVNLQKLIDLAENRQAHMVTNAQRWGFSNVGQMMKATYYVKGNIAKNDDSYDAINRLILTESDEKNRNVEALSKNTAVQPFVLIQTLIALENNGLVTFVKPPVSPPSTIETPQLAIQDTPAAEPTQIPDEKKLPNLTTAAPATPAKPFPAKRDEPHKGTAQMTLPTANTTTFDIIDLVEKLKDGLNSQGEAIEKSETTLLGYNQRIQKLQQEIARIQAEVSHVEMQAEVENGLLTDLKNQRAHALETLKGFKTE